MERVKWTKLTEHELRSYSGGRSDVRIWVSFLIEKIWNL